MSRNFQIGYTNLLIPIILILGLIVGVYLIKQSTNIFPKAYNTVPNEIEETATIEYPPDLIVSSNDKFGIAIDIKKKEKIPNADQLQALSPGWVRFVVTPSTIIPSFPKKIKKLVIFNAESVPGKPEDTDFSEEWHVYIDKYVKALEDFIKQNPDKVDAIEVWNEEDICDTNYDYCPGVSEVIYADILKRASSAIKRSNPDIKVIMGGLITNDIFNEDGGYLKKLLKIDPDLFNQVDALGLHPYGKTLNNWCTCTSLEPEFNKDGSKNNKYCTTNIDSIADEEKCGAALPWGDIKESVSRYKAAILSHVKIWVTEVGQATNDNEWQKEYMKMIFDYLPSEAEVVIWYAWTDKMLAVEDVETDVMQMGLYDRKGNLKPAGELFKTYSTNE